MSLFFRLLAMILTVARQERVGALDEVRLQLRVWPSDLDLNLHMNNGRYLTLMDLGRMALVGRTGIWREALARRWAPMVGAATIRFRRSLEPFQSYELVTRIVGWDQKWFFMEQRFERQGKVVAYAMVKGLFRAKTGNVTPDEVLALAGVGRSSPPLPEGVLRWNEGEAALVDGR